MLRGCVVATYVVDDPSIDPNTPPYMGETPRVVYCDVMCYTTIPGQRFIYLQKALVAQPRGGLHNGKVWKPRAAKIDITGEQFVPTGASNPGNWDGDHVIVGFLDDMLNQPVVLYGIPHPAQDFGNENDPVGQRLALKVADGDPDFHKHYGSYYGLDDKGDFVVDLQGAYTGPDYQPDGKEPDPPGDGSVGNVKIRLPVVSKLTVEIDGQPSITLDLSGPDAKLTVGDGAKKVAIADYLKTMWEDLVNTKFPTHTHVDGFGGTGPVNSGPVTPWDPAIESTKVTIPDT
jgi:hypothetical protein